MDDANLDMALRAVLFAAVGTAGQRCTTNRRLVRPSITHLTHNIYPHALSHIPQLLHESIHDAFVERLSKAYAQVRIGDPFEAGVLCGPLHSAAAVANFTAVWILRCYVSMSERGQAVQQCKAEGGQIVQGGKVLERPGFFVEPTIVLSKHDAKSEPCVKQLFHIHRTYIQLCTVRCLRPSCTSSSSRRVMNSKFADH